VLDALDGVIDAEGAGRASELVRAIVERGDARRAHSGAQTTPYVNTIRSISKRISPVIRDRRAAAPLVRWNAWRWSCAPTRKQHLASSCVVLIVCDAL